MVTKTRRMKTKKATLVITLYLAAWCMKAVFLQPPNPGDDDAAALLEQGRPTEALALFMKNRLQTEPSAQDCFVAGCSHQLLLAKDSAIFYLQSAIEKTGISIPADEIFRKRTECHLAANLPYDTACQILNGAIAFFASRQMDETQEMAEALSLLGTLHTRQANFDLAKPLLLQSLEVFQAIGKSNCSQAGTTQRTLGYLFWRKSAYETAVAHNRLTEKIFLERGGQDNFHLWSLYLNWAGCSNDVGVPHKAIDYSRKALSYLSANYPGHPNLPNVYNNLGNAFKLIRDFPKAIQYFKEAIALEPNTGRFYNNLGDVYSVSGDTANARVNFLKAIELLLPKEAKESENLARPFHNLAGIFRQQQDFQKALDYEKKSLIYRKKAHGNNPHLDLARTCYGIGESFAGLGNYEKAIAWFDSALLIQHQVLPSGQHPEIASAWLGKARAFSKIREEQKQEIALDSALYAAGYEGKAAPAMLSTIELVEALSENGMFHLQRGRQTGSTEAVSKAVRLYADAADALRLHRRLLPEEGARFSLADRHFALFENAISASCLLAATDPAGIQSAFMLAEQSKSLALVESMKASNALHFSKLPDSLLEKERRLRLSLNLLEQNQLDPEKKEVADEPGGRYFQAKQAHDLFVKDLEEKHPEYYRLKYDVTTVALDEVRSSLLQPGQTLLEYFIGDRSIFIFVVSKDRCEVKEVKKDFPLEDMVRRLRACVTDERSTGSAEYAELAGSLYQKLLLPVEGLPGNELVIVPDGILGYLPFELLLTEKPANPLNFRTHRYLLHKHQISYCYSATLLQEMKNKRHRQEPEQSLLAFAPYYDGDTTLLANLFASTNEVRKDLQPLPNSGEEVFNIAKMTKGKAYYGDEATEEKFTALAGNYRALHLSTHGQANDRRSDYSFLAFSEIKDSLENELLFVRDVYKLALNADLVVLSACETGIGKLQRGEGIISLARAFTYAGAKSIVTSLWSVSDPKTKDLMVNFYRHLSERTPLEKKGNAKDEALRQAKLDYLSQKNLTHPNAHPYYWAGFIAIGDMQAVDF